MALRLSAHWVLLLGRILKVGVQNLKQGVQVQWTTISDVSVGRVCHVAGQFCAVAIYIWAIPALLTLHLFNFSIFIEPQ